MKLGPAHSINMHCLPGGGPGVKYIQWLLTYSRKPYICVRWEGVPAETWVAKKAASVPPPPKLTITPTQPTNPLMSKISDNTSGVTHHLSSWHTGWLKGPKGPLYLCRWVKLDWIVLVQVSSVRGPLIKGSNPMA